MPKAAVIMLWWRISYAKPSPSGVPNQIPQALAAAQDPKYRYQQPVPGRDANAQSHARVRDRLEVADQIEIGSSRNALEHREEAIPPT